MRPTLLAGEWADSFLHVLAFFEKQGVLESLESWQEIRNFRNAAAHDYETEYGRIAEHFNTLAQLAPVLLVASAQMKT